MRGYRILIRTVKHTNVVCFAWHAVLCADDDPERMDSFAAKIWETDNREIALAEYTRLLKTHAANDLTLLQPVDVDVLAKLHEDIDADAPTSNDELFTDEGNSSTDTNEEDI